MKGEQFKQLPTTTSSYVVDDKGTEAYFLFIVLLIFAVTNQMLTIVPIEFIAENCFPLAVVFSVIIYFAFKRYLNGKPPKFLIHLMQYPALPKKYTHQHKEPAPPVSDPESL